MPEIGTPVNSELFDARMGTLWVQPDGPNTQVYPLNCHDLGDIDEPFGDITRRFCPDPNDTESWNLVLRRQGPPGEVSTTITTYVGKTSDWLERQHGCAMPIYANMRHCGPGDVWGNYERYFTLPGGLFTSKGITNLAMREGTDASEQSFGLSADPPVYRIFPLVLTRQTTLEAQALNDLAFCNAKRCQGPCGSAMDLCQTGYAVADAAAEATADVVETTDGGVGGWTATATDPFAADENISTIACFYIDATTTRILVGRGTTDAANPAEVAYSDDGGATWTNVNVGSTNGEYLPWNGSLFALNHRNIWAGLDSGDIYFSDDAGLTWTEQVSANAGANAINCIKFVNENLGLFGGDLNTLYYTEDGGSHWSALTGPFAGDNVTALAMIDAYRYWCGNEDGELWYTMDGATNWSERSYPQVGVGTLGGINDLTFIDEYHGAFVNDWQTNGDYQGSIYRTFNGGHDWEQHTPTDDTFTSGGFNAVWMCHPNLIFAVGEPGDTDATAMIYTAYGGQGAY